MLVMGLNDVSNMDYHADKEFLSSSNLKTIIKDPQQFYNEKILGLREEKTNTAFEEGSLTHSIILEPALVQQEYAFYEGLRKQGTAYEVFAAQNKGKTIISKPQRLRVDAYKAAYDKNPIANKILSGGESEKTICQLVSEVPCKIRCDYINVEKGYIADIKTTAHPSEVDSFRMTVSQFGYDISSALYVRVASQYYGKEFDFYFVVINKQTLVCDVYKASRATLEKGTGLIGRALSIYKQCKSTGVWKLASPAPVVTDEILEV